jgi:2-oxoglutarate dehydrogenase E2 component (dihydrolipoamide succinyltransferase)
MLAKQRGLSPDDLRLVRGSGLNGSITKEDITMYMINGRHDKADNKNAKSVEKKPVSGNGVSVPLPTAGPDDEVVEMDRIRKLIAGNMIRSIQLAPHVTSFREADVTPLMEWRERIKTSFLEREKVKLTFTAMLTEAVALALKEFPRINVSVAGDSIIIRKHIHIGIATALPDGNLIVPVIKNADRQNLGGLARIINDLAHRARNAMLLPGESGGGTFTITNIGQYNSLTGTPVINQPESAILAAGTISKKPWAIKTSDGYGIAVRDIIMLSLTYDHRVIDGALGSGFLDCIARHLENFDVKREL